MAQRLREVMIPNPAMLSSSSSVTDAARCMKEQDIGDVLVLDNDRLCGVITDRDIVVRSIAAGHDPGSTILGEICSADLVGLSPDDTVDDAVRMMRERAVRRLPVVEAGRPVGIVSLGDLAIDRDPGSALADISAAPPNQ
jgi:CBS domain-containing protein